MVKSKQHKGEKAGIFGIKVCIFRGVELNHITDIIPYMIKLVTLSNPVTSQSL